MGERGCGGGDGEGVKWGEGSVLVLVLMQNFFNKIEMRVFATIAAGFAFLAAAYADVTAHEAFGYTVSE